MIVLTSNSDLAYLFLFFVVIPAAVFLAIFIPIAIVRSVYTKFVKTHAASFKELTALNRKYHFRDVVPVSYRHQYDNENFFDTVSTQDYLIYQLQFDRKEIEEGIADALFNKSILGKYEREVENCTFGEYDTDKLLHSKRILNRTEKRVFEKTTQHPAIDYLVHIRLDRVKMNGDRVTYKQNVFDSREITQIIRRMDLRKGVRYLDENIWQAICRVERAKVTNKMRFAIYSRDGYRCRICHRKTNDLEIDHIWPIAKGGKTTYDNLQTLCHRCNTKKGASVDY